MGFVRSVWIVLGSLVAMGGGVSLMAEDVYLEPDTFIEESFVAVPEKKVLWLTKDLKGQMADIMGHPYKGLRIRYWQDGERTAWILEEIGKVELITAGFVVEADEMQEMKVLVYRESHGWEVRYPFFTQQFSGLKLQEKRKLNKDIDGISGATLSVNALVRLSRLALFLHKEATK